MIHEQTIKFLGIAEAVSSMELYVVFSDNSKPSYGFRLWDGLKNLPKEEAKQFVREFNETTSGLRNRWKRRYEDKAEENLSRIRGLR